MAILFRSSIFLLLFISIAISPSSVKIGVKEVKSDSHMIIPFDEFGFTRRGHLELNVSSISLSNPKADLSKVGFFLSTRKEWIQVVEQINESDYGCPLDSKLIGVVYTFKSLKKGATSFSTEYSEPDPDQYILIFSNCAPNLVISMKVRSDMYNLEGKTGVRDYLSAGETVLPRVYFLLSLVYFVLITFWVAILQKKKSTAFKIHFFMLVVLILKALNLLCKAEDKSFIKKTGSANGWDVLFYIFSFLKGISLFTLIVLIGTGWSFLKPYLQDKEKKVLMMVIPLQVISNIAQIVIDETGPFCFLLDNLCWISAKATSEASRLAEILILQTGMTAFGKAYYRHEGELMSNLEPKLEALGDEYVRFGVNKCSSVLREYHAAVETITDVLLERGEIDAEEIWDIYKKAPRIPQPPVSPVDEYGALIYAGRWGIHGISCPGRVTFSPGSVGFATFGAPRPMETQVISDETWKLVDEVKDRRMKELRSEALEEVEEEEPKPLLLMTSHFM